MHDIGHGILAGHNDPLNKGRKEESKAVDDGQSLKADCVFDLEFSHLLGVILEENPN